MTIVGSGLHSSPWDAVKTLLSATSHQTSSVGKFGGVGALWTGYHTILAREIPFSILQYPLYEGLKRLMISRSAKSSSSDEKTNTPPMWQLCLCGSLAGGVAAAMTTPLDVVKTRTMTQNMARSSVPYQVRGLVTKYVTLSESLFVFYLIRFMFRYVTTMT